MVKTLAVMAPAQKQRAPATTGSVKHVLTMTEKILERTSERSQLDPGENVWVNIDVLMTHNICGPGTFGIFKQEFGEDAKALSCSALSVIGDRYYKVTAEVLRVCEELVHVLRPTNEPFYNAILTRLENQDQDQEVKECAISCMSLVISTFDNNLQRQLPTCLPILVDRMGNEITRRIAVKVIARQSIDKSGHCELQDSNVEKMLCLLFNHCESEEEGVRKVVAECLGKIALLE